MKIVSLTKKLPGNLLIGQAKVELSAVAATSNPSMLVQKWKHFAN
jgi:hypothetical protein